MSNYFNPRIITYETEEFNRVMYSSREKARNEKIKSMSNITIFLKQLMGPSACAEIHNSVLEERPGGLHDLSFDELVVKFHSFAVLNKEARLAAELVLQQQIHVASDFPQQYK